MNTTPEKLKTLKHENTHRSIYVYTVIIFDKKNNFVHYLFTQQELKNFFRMQ